MNGIGDNFWILSFNLLVDLWPLFLYIVFALGFLKSVSAIISLVIYRTDAKARNNGFLKIFVGAVFMSISWFLQLVETSITGDSSSSSTTILSYSSAVQNGGGTISDTMTQIRSAAFGVFAFIGAIGIVVGLSLISDLGGKERGSPYMASVFIIFGGVLTSMGWWMPKADQYFGLSGYLSAFFGSM